MKKHRRLQRWQKSVHSAIKMTTGTFYRIKQFQDTCVNSEVKAFDYRIAYSGRLEFVAQGPEYEFIHRLNFHNMRPNRGRE